MRRRKGKFPWWVIVLIALAVLIGLHLAGLLRKLWDMTFLKWGLGEYPVGSDMFAPGVGKYHRRGAR